MKKAVKCIGQWFSYFGEVLTLLKRIGRVEPGYLIGYVINIILSAVIPFNSILFIKLLLDEFVNHRRFDVSLLYVFLMCGINFLYRFLTACLNRQEQMALERIKAKFLLDVEEVTMTMPYDKLENAKAIDQRQKAMEVFYPTMTGFMDLHKTMYLFRTLLANLLQLFGFVSILLTLNSQVLLIMFVICLFSIIIESIASEKEFKVWNITLVQYGRKLGYLQDVGTNLAYAKELRIYQLSNWLSAKLTDVINKIIKDVSKTVRWFVMVACISNALIILFNGGLFLYFYLLASDKIITLAEVTVYFNTVSSFIVALLAISNSLVILFKSGHYLQSYNEYMNMGTEEESSFPMEQNKEIFSEDMIQNMSLEFRDVWFRYPGSQEDTLRGVSFNIAPGSKIAIVGDNGAGKTTVIKLLMKFYQPDSGTILLNGVEIQNIPNKKYYEYISAVFQDFKVLNYSLKENIAFDKLCDQTELDQIIKDLQMGEMVSRLPSGQETICGRLFGEEGIELSGGQAQKVAIARALLKNSGVIILDEPTAMLSPAGEFEIYQNLNDLTMGKTAIFISHRMSSCRFCDNIIVLEQGKIVEQGDHLSLMKLNGLYFKMFTTQAQFYQDMQNIE